MAFDKYGNLVNDKPQVALAPASGLIAEANNNSLASTTGASTGSLAPPAPDQNPPYPLPTGGEKPIAPDKNNPFPLPNPTPGPPPPPGPGPTPPMPTPMAPADNPGDVFEELKKALDPNSDYIRQARQAGLQVAGKRGLMNSSIAAGTSEAAALERAGPLAIANAQLKNSLQLQREQVFSTEKLATQQLSSQELMQMRDIASKQGMLTQELDATFRNLQFASGEEKMRLQLQLSQDWQKAQLAANTAITQSNIDANSKLEQIAAQGNVQLNLQQLQNLNDQQKAQLAGFLELNNQYTNALNNLYANKDMPAATRDAAINMFTQLRNSNIDFTKQVWGLDLNWGQGTGTSTGTSTGTGTGTFTPSLIPGVTGTYSGGGTVGSGVTGTGLVGGNNVTSDYTATSPTGTPGTSTSSPGILDLVNQNPAPFVPSTGNPAIPSGSSPDEIERRRQLGITV